MKNQTNMKKILTLFAFFGACYLHAQVMPSPDASALIKGINTPVNLYNGVASVSIPLYEAESNGAGKIPVTIQYQTGGIKVQEISSVAGLGWQLQAGGAITRVVRSKPDDQVKYTTQIKYDQLRDVALNKEKYDFEKDLFFFAFPGGGGKFIFSKDIYSEANKYTRCNQSGYENCMDACGTSLDCFGGCEDSYESVKAYTCPGWYADDIVTLPSSDVQIRFYYRGKLNSYFVITDTQGNKFYFGQSSSSREKTILNSKDNFHNTEYKDENKKEFISTWHLDKVEFASLPASQNITFNYTGASITEETKSTIVPATSYANLYVDCMVGKSSGANCDDCMEFNKKISNPYNAFDNPVEWARYEFHIKYYRNSITTQKSTIQSKFVSSINFAKGKIRFAYASRSDLTNGLRLASVSLHDHTNKLVSRTELDHNYFSSNDSYYKGVKRGYVGDKGLRLKLEGIRKDGLVVSSFDYINDTHFHGGGIDKFELPPRDSYYTDHWGYYNGGPHQGQMYTWHKNVTVEGEAIGGIKKYHTQYAKANILTKIHYATGGHKEFFYGKHDHHGGVRVDRIVERDENNNNVVDIKYTYEDEYDDPNDISYVENHVVTVLQDRNEVTGKITPHIFESSKTFVFDLNGPTNGYGKVTEQNQITGSKAIHEFVNAGDRKLKYANKFFATVDTYQDEYWTNTTTPINIYAFPFTTPTLEFFDRGQEKKVTYFDENGVRTKVVEKFFKHDSEFDHTISNHSFHLYHLDEDAGLFVDNSFEYKFIVSEYFINTRNFKLDYVITKNFNDSGGLITENKTDYTYSSTFETIPIIVKSEVKDGTKVLYGKSKKTLYPFNKDEISIVHSNAVLDEMVEKNMIAVPVQNISSVREPGAYLYEYSGNSLTTFKKSHSLIVPHKSYIFPMTGLISYIFYVFDPQKFELISTMEYNDQGLIQSKIGQDKIKTEYEYDSRGYLTSVTMNPGVASLARTTHYEYYPLIGVKSTTDPNGRKTTHKYDERNRLLFTKDHNGNIVKRYRYNYANENNQANFSLSVDDGYNKTCKSVRFVVNKTGQEYGVTTYKWNFGDGSNSAQCGGGLEGPQPSGNSNGYESTSNYASHVFTEPGNYTVSVTAFNPEYGEEKVLTQNITIHELYAEAKIYGADSRENCSSSNGSQEFEHDSGAVDETIEGSGGSGSGHPSIYFSIGFDGAGARCQDYGTAFAVIKYKNQAGNWIAFGEDGRGNLPGAAFYTSTNDYTIDIMGEIQDNCSSIRQTAYHTITIKPCSSNSGGTGGTGGTGDGDGPIDPDGPSDEFLDPGDGGGVE